MVQDACIRQFEIIGEATKRISEELKKRILIYHGKIWQHER